MVTDDPLNANSESELSVKRAVFKLLSHSFPCMISMFFSLLIEQISVIFLGKYTNSLDFGAAELGTMTVNILCFSFGFGILGATDTLASQAFGRDQLKLVGQILKRSQIILALAFIPMALLIVWLRPVLDVITVNTELNDLV